jgi:prepilin-type N-terminal cleavage/methylation domain-containing protein
MKRVQQGFTLIELMIVIAIVAILVALAVPAYKDYTVRTKVAECINGAAVPKLSISEFYESETAWPADENEAGTASPAGISRYCEGFTYSTDGQFEILVNESAVGSSATIQPEMVPTSNAQGGVDWQCSSGSTATSGLKYIPASCR